MRKLRTWLDFELTENDMEVVSEEVLVQPGQSIPLRELLERFARGEAIPSLGGSYTDDDLNEETFDRPDWEVDPDYDLADYANDRDRLGSVEDARRRLAVERRVRQTASEESSKESEGDGV